VTWFYFQDTGYLESFVPGLPCISPSVVVVLSSF